jgi:ATP-binding cassette subfamily B protein/ATP-binding cassette subfamily C protein
MEKGMNIPLKRYWTLLVDYLRPQWPRVALLAILLLGQIGLQLVSPQFLRRFIDRAMAGSALRELTAAALAFLALSLVGQVATLLTTYLGENVAWTATNALRRDLTLHCLQLDMPFHKSHTPGELIERIDGDVNALANFFSRLVIYFAGNALLALGILVVLFRENPLVGGVGAAYALLALTVLRAVRVPAVRAWGESRQAEAEMVGFFGERLTGTEDIRANGAEPYVMSRLYQLMRTISRRWMRAKLLHGLSMHTASLLSLLARVAALALGVILYEGGQMTIGTVYLVLHYLGMLRTPMDHIQGQINNLQRASASIERVDQILGERPSVTEIPARGTECGRAALSAGALPVAFDRVSFRYDDGIVANGLDSVVDGVSFDLAAGVVLGLLGRTGSGKTTLTRLLFRLYDPTAGAVRLGGVDLRQVGLGDLRRRVGLVTQDVQLFRASVRHNLTLFNARIPDQRLLNALRELGLWEWYQALPDGLDTELQAGGQSLSAGEAQLLAFTRVYLKDPGLVILDEASSRLDPATEQLLERAIGRLLRGRTAIVIAHRLATVQRVDEILILEEGRIAEHGDRQRLANDPASRFYRLLRTGLEDIYERGQDVPKAEREIVV